MNTTVGQGAAATTTTFPSEADNPPPGNVPPATTTTAPPRAIPNVIGDTEVQAASSVSAAGLNPQFTTDTGCAGGTVNSQNPAAGTTVRAETTVIMEVCGGSATTAPVGATTTTTQQGLL
ncbi:MAG TPA: PASTA domain-containing protein [Acidimicrobiales bacterium]|jgi:beta-lactam-binding protein with PASTA domain